MQIIDDHDERVDVTDGHVVIEETRNYRLLLNDPTTVSAVSFGELAIDAESPGTYRLQIGFWIGTNALVVRRGVQEDRVLVRVEPRREKLSEGQWLSMLTELETWTSGASLGFEGGLRGALNQKGHAASALSMALGPLLPALERAVMRVIERPREGEAVLREDHRLHAIRRADRETLQWLSRHPSEASAVLPSDTAAVAAEPWIPRRISIDTVDHPVNRYIAWLLARVLAHVDAIAARLDAQARSQAHAVSDTSVWCAARATALRANAASLKRCVRRSFLARLKPEPPTETVLLAVLDDPAYARCHAIARRFLSPSFVLEGEGEAPQRPSYTLYELWCFFAVKRAFERFVPRAEWKWTQRDSGDLLGGFAEGSRWDARGDGELSIEFNPTFASWRARKSAQRFSISGERRPDIVVSWRPTHGAQRWFFFDAKYRVAARAIEESFESAHIYRDALRWPEMGGRCRGGWLLVPKVSADCADWSGDEFFEANGCGVIEWAPGGNGNLVLPASVVRPMEE